MTEEEKEKLKKILDSAHINFLIGSGASCNYLKTLWSIETLLSESNKQLALNPSDEESLINYSIKHKYLKDCIEGNLDFLKLNDELKEEKSEFSKTYENYNKFINAINTILIRRKTNVINRQVNLFTTNMDLFLDSVLEQNNLNFNDGFSGRMKPIFSTSNYKKAIYQTSSHYDNISEMPTFNLFKLHGSVNWRKEKINGEEKIIYDQKFSVLKEISKLEKQENVLDVNNKSTHKSLKGDIPILENEDSILIQKDFIENFQNKYDELVFVNPTKEKFQLTTIDYVFYEQLRMYSNALEKENSVLFVHGFSFADEHIKEITARAAKGNPTLIIYIFCFSKDEVKKIKDFFNGANNIEYICNAEEYTFQLQIDEYFEPLAKEFDTNFWRGTENKKSEIEVSTDSIPKEDADGQ